MEALWKYASVYLLSGLKFIFGPTLGVSYGIPVVITALLTTLGMMTSVYIFTYFSEPLKGLVEKFRSKHRKKFSKRSRRFVTLWRKYGVKGIALISPILLTPIGGTVLANVLGGKKEKIIRWMWFSSLSWAFIITLIVKYAYWIIREVVVV